MDRVWRKHLAILCGSLGALAGLVLTASPAVAQQVVESYVARLSEADHFNSSGRRLTGVAAILRQDRANVHRFGVIDDEDESDMFFADAGNRGALERLIRRDGVSPRAARRIVDGTPLVRVSLLRDRGGVYATVVILED